LALYMRSMSDIADIGRVIRPAIMGPVDASHSLSSLDHEHKPSRCPYRRCAPSIPRAISATPTTIPTRMAAEAFG
jgi:hypothetical protein